MCSSDLDREEDGRDYMTVRVEGAEELETSQNTAIAQQISGEIKKRLMVSSQVEIVAYGSLPRSERKSKRLFDNRQA